MDAIVAKKMKTEIRIGLIIAVLSLLLLLAILFILRINTDLSKRTALAESQVKKYRKTIGEDVEVLIDAQKTLKYSLDQDYLGLKKSLSITNLNSYANKTPLSFKKLLFEVQERIVSQAKHKNVTLPQDLGFADYNLLLPKDSQVLVLMNELDIFEEVISLLIDSRVQVIKSIKLPHKFTSKNIERKDSAVSFRSLEIKIAVETEFKQMKDFLLDLAASERTYIIKQLNINKIDEASDRLIADINIESMEL